MKKNKIRFFYVVFFLLPGCALFSPPQDNTKALTEKLKDLESEIRVQRQEIQNLQAQVRKSERKTAVEKKKVTASVKNKSEKLKSKNKRIELSYSAPLPEEDATIVDSSHEELHKYFKGVQLIRDKKTDEGLIQLKEFISENPSHVYADRAQMLISDTYLKNKDYGLVIVSTNVLENRYPQSTKLQEALFKRAAAFLALDQKDQAKKTLERVMKEFPRTRISEMAEKRMASLKTPLMSDVP